VLFVPRMGGDLLQGIERSMDSLVEHAKEMADGDVSGPIHRDMKFEAPGIQMEVEFSSETKDNEGDTKKPGSIFDIFQNSRHKKHPRRPFMHSVMKRAAKLRRKMMKKLRRMRHGIPRWMQKMKGGALAFQKKQVFKMNFKKALSERCEEEERLCPPIRCPMKLIKCLQKKRAKISSQSCGTFVDQAVQLRHKIKAIKHEFKLAKKACKQNNDEWEPRKICIKAAKRDKWQHKTSLFEEFSQSLKSSTMVLKDSAEKDSNAATEFFDTKMNSLKAFMGLGAGKCKNDDSCQNGGDMGGYCKDNGDCHCTAPFFGSDGKGGCALTCTPSSKTPCCRDDADCKADGDKDAYCKSPKSSSSTTPGNGMCRCGTGFSGTTSCHKAEPDEAKDLLPGKHMSEMTPGWITGDIEEPAGEKDMGGWTARAYTPEQQERLGVNEMGEVSQKEAAVSSDNDAKMLNAVKAEQPWILISMLAAFAAVVLTVGLYIKKRSAIKAIELNAVYDHLGKGSFEQV